MTPRDALMYWMTEKIPNDQFLLYCFDAPTESLSEICARLIRRATGIADLCVRVQDAPWGVDYPYWVARDDSASPISVHDLADHSWAGCRAAVADLLGTTVDARVSPWRLHVFDIVYGAPGGDGPAVVVVLQLSHALADGRRAAQIARDLFGAGELEPAAVGGAVPQPVMLARAAIDAPWKIARVFQRSLLAAQAYRRANTLVDRGDLPPQIPGRELTEVNAEPGDRHDVRIVARQLDELRGLDVTVTVAVLTAVSIAMSEYLAGRGSVVPERLGAEVTVAGDPDERKKLSRNNFHNVGVDLFPAVPNLRIRARRIADALADRRTRSAHPAIRAQSNTMDVLPAPVVKAGISAFDTAARPATVSGNTVLTSVHRGAGDLRFGSGAVRFTAGFPALSPAMGLTHGVYSIGDTLTVSIHSSPAAVPDPDRYETLLDQAIVEVCWVLRP